MILHDGIDTADRTGKYSDGMAVLLEQRWMDGDCDDETGSVDTTGHCVRFGRRIMVTTNDGFVVVERYATVDHAETAMEALRTLEHYITVGD